MTELIISDITRMGSGLCVLGVQADGAGFRSVRPLPPGGYAWPLDFPHRRGDRVLCSLSTGLGVPPHVEDCPSRGLVPASDRLQEQELIDSLRRAEVAGALRDLFQTRVTVQRRGAFIWPTRAVRSICGVNPARVRLKMEASEIRAAVALPSGESLPDLPVVDRSWHSFGEQALAEMSGANRPQRLNRFLAELFAQLAPERLFVRIGVTRPKARRCWLMVDSLFPIPRKSWLEALLGNPPPKGSGDERA